MTRGTHDAPTRHDGEVAHYCDFAPTHPVHESYHASEYGFPTREETALFERLVLEINQAGLSWETILRKRPGFLAAYDGFDVAKVAAYGAAERERLLSDVAIIRNRLKIEAAIHNAGVIYRMREEGGFDSWLASHHPLSKDEWVRLFKKTFHFTGGEITGEFLMSTGWIPGAHREDCPIAIRLSRASGAKRPRWLS